MMMRMLLNKNPSSLFPCYFPKTIVLHLSFSSPPKDQNPPPKFNFITEYLITSCGFSPLKAISASKRIVHITSSEKPDSVRHFFKHHGFTDADIRKVIAGYPSILCSDIDRTLQPNIDALRQLGISEHQLLKFIAHAPLALILRSSIPRIQFWKDFLGSDVRKLFIAFTRNRNLIGLDIDKNVTPKISLLKEYGLSEPDIEIILLRSGSLICRGTDSMEALLKRVQEMGFQAGSRLFRSALSTLSTIGPDQLKSKMALFKSFGWSEGEFLAAFQKFPGFVHLSEEHLREKMEFLVKTAGCTQSYITSHPVILSYSLQKRLMPRCHVMTTLKSHKLVGKDRDFYAMVVLSDQKFLKKIILRFKDEVPTLFETYFAACD